MNSSIIMKSGHFPPGMEAEFQIVSRDRFVQFLRAGLAMSICVHPLWLIWDYRMGGAEVFDKLAMIRAGIICISAVLMAMTFRTQFKRFINALTAIAIIINFTGTAFILHFIKDGFIIGLAGIVIPFFIIPLMATFRSALYTAVICLAAMNIVMAWGGQSIDTFINANFFLVSWVTLSVIVNYIVSENRLALFLSEKNLAAAKDEAEKANSVKSAFLATMSHEVRTPLNGILGIVNLLQDTGLNAAQKNYAQTIQYSGEALQVLLNDILDFSKIEAGKMEVERVNFNLDTLIHTVVDLMQSRASEKGLLIRHKLEITTPENINTDPTRLRQVLLNLLSNAIKFTDDGFIDLRVSTVHEEGWDATLRFEVKDTGTGITEEVRQNLFQEFVQADSSISRKYGGTGLGLAICKNIVELLGGKIGVDSEPGKGSTFWFLLPVTIVDSEFAQEIVEDKKAYVRTKPLRILLAEDNKVNQLVAIGLLEKMKHDITLVQNGNEAIKAAAENDYDLILMDLQMPVLDGLSAAREIKKLGGGKEQIPIIALTANAMRGDDERYRAAGMVDHIGKPIYPVEFYRKIARHVPDSKLEEPLDDDHAESSQSLTPSERIIDRAYLLQIEKSMGKKYAETFVRSCIEQIKKYLKDARGATHDSKQFLHSAHEIKSMSSALGMGDIASLAEGVEICCAEEKIEDAVLLIEKIEEVFAARLPEYSKIYNLGTSV